MGYLNYVWAKVWGLSDCRKAGVLGGAGDTVPSVHAVARDGEGVDGNRQTQMLRAVVHGLKNGKFQNIVVMCGAGVSVSAGIPDLGRGRAYIVWSVYIPFPTQCPCSASTTSMKTRGLSTTSFARCC